MACLIEQSGCRLEVMQEGLAALQSLDEGGAGSRGLSGIEQASWRSLPKKV
jgi:hypothetical protein